jgi:hypothetical protein
MSLTSLFDKNIFSLDDKITTIDNKTKDDCMKESIKNKSAGFSYKGDNNKCLLFDSHNLNNRTDENIKAYNIKSFIYRDR